MKQSKSRGVARNPQKPPETRQIGGAGSNRAFHSVGVQGCAEQGLGRRMQTRFASGQLGRLSLGVSQKKTAKPKSNLTGLPFGPVEQK